MLRSWFGGKKRKGKSVNDMRGGKPRPRREKQPIDEAEARIKALKAKNLKLAEIKAALAGAGQVAQPDVAGAIAAAKAMPAEAGMEANKAAITRALRLKGSAQVIDDSLAHPAWRYVAMAVIRGLLEEEQIADRGSAKPQKRDK